MLVGAAFSWVPSFWWDEAATISAANRPLSGWAALHADYDAVHALHNLILHGWFSLVGISEFTARIPGAIALGAGTAAVTATGQRLAGRGAGVAAGLLFVVLPRVTWAATEARSYAFTIACAALLTLCLVLALTRRPVWWVPYTLLVVVSTLMFVYSATLLAAHALTVLVVGRRRDRWRFVAAAVVGFAATTPFLLLTYSQVRQVSWIPPLDATVVYTVLVDQWFPGAPWTALLSYVLVVAAAVVAARRGVTPGERLLLWLAVPGCTVPVAVILARSLGSDNMYLDRYVSFTVPSVVLLVGWAVTRLTTRWWSTAILLVCLAATALPAYFAQRQPFAKAGGMDYSATADRLIDIAEPGDCLAFEPAASWNPTSPRSLADARPDLAEHLDDVGLQRSAADRDDLWSLDLPPHELAAAAAGRCEVLWVVADRDRTVETRVRNSTNEWTRFEPYRFTDTETYRQLEAAGFTIVDREPVHLLQLIRMVQTQ